MENNWIPENIIAYFASSPIGPFFEVSDVANDKNHPLSKCLNNLFNEVPQHLLDKIIKNADFMALYGNSSNINWFAREQAIIRELNERINVLRMQIISEQATVERPLPYNDKALIDLNISDDKLVPLSEFQIEDGVLLRNGKAFMILPSTPAVNSSYWLTRALSDKSIKNQIYVRLDPFLYGNAQSFPRISFKMLWYGPPLNWNDIIAMHDEKFGRWSPGSLSNRSEFTDYACVPRAYEHHMYI